MRDVELATTEAGAGSAFFWGHGLTGSVGQDDRAGMFAWGRLASRHRVVRWDARGHGGSGGGPDPDDYRWDNLGRDLLALADAFGIERFAAGGVSMGAATALHAAAAAPDRIERLVLALAPTGYETRRAQADRYRSGADLVERAGLDAYFEQVNGEPVPEILRPVADQYRFAPQVPESLLPAVLRGAAASDLPDAEVVARLTQPTLVLAWDTDPGHPLATAERLAELLPHAELVVARRLRDVVSWTDRVDGFLLET